MAAIAYRKRFLHLILSLFLLSAFQPSVKATVTASFSFSPPGTAPATISFINMSSSSGEQIISHSWNFGDGNVSTVANPVHIYTNPGFYMVRLAVTGSLSNSDTVVMVLVISQAPPTTTPVFANNMGKEFWAGYGHHQLMETGTNAQNMIFNFTTGNEPALVTIKLDSSGPVSWSRSYLIPANTSISTENIPKGIVNAIQSSSDPNHDARLFTDPPPLGFASEGLFRKKGIHIVSTAPVSVQAQIYAPLSSAITTLLPVESWGYNYYSINSEQRDANSSFSWVFVIAKEDNTIIQITPTAISRNGQPANTPFLISLMKGQIYQLPSYTDAQGIGGSLTGTIIRSIPGTDGNYHPIAVFAGSSRTGGESIPCGTGSGRDNEIQQLFPTTSWGKEFLTAPFSKASGSGPGMVLNADQFQTSIFKILVKDPTTVVRRNGVILNSLVNNSHYKFSSNTADVITADKPISIGQFMSGTTSCNGGLGDPDMVYPSPVELAVKKAIFNRTSREAIYATYVTVILPTSGIASLTIDGSNIFNYTYAHPNKAGYSVVIKGWPALYSTCTIRSDSSFAALCYGLGSAESYAFNAGTNLKIADSLDMKICAGAGSTNLPSNINGNLYKWQVNTGSGFTGIQDNSFYSGTSTATLQLSNLPHEWHGYKYRSIVDGEIGTTFTIKYSNQWTGAISNAWENPGNWSCGTVPGLTTDVIIPSGAIVVLTSNITIRSLSLHPGASFTVSTGFTITITNP